MSEKPIDGTAYTITVRASDDEPGMYEARCAEIRHLMELGATPEQARAELALTIEALHGLACSLGHWFPSPGHIDHDPAFEQ